VVSRNTESATSRWGDLPVPKGEAGMSEVGDTGGGVGEWREQDLLGLELQ